MLTESGNLSRMIRPNSSPSLLRDCPGLPRVSPAFSWQNARWPVGMESINRSLTRRCFLAFKLNLPEIGDRLDSADTGESSQSGLEGDISRFEVSGCGCGVVFGVEDASCANWTFVVIEQGELYLTTWPRISSARLATQNVHKSQKAGGPRDGRRSQPQSDGLGDFKDGLGKVNVANGLLRLREQRP